MVKKFTVTFAACNDAVFCSCFEMTPIKYHNTTGDQWFQSKGVCGERIMVFGNAKTAIVVDIICLKTTQSDGPNEWTIIFCIEEWVNKYKSFGNKVITHEYLLSLEQRFLPFYSRPITHTNHNYSLLIHSCHKHTLCMKILKQYNFK